MAIKMGHPKKGEVREKLVQVNFNADAATLSDIAALESLAPEDVKYGRRTEMIRRAIRAYREQLEKGAP